MSLQSLIDEKLSRLDSVPDAFLSAVERHQKQVLESVLKLMDSLETDNGVIIASVNNLKRIEAIMQTVNDTLLGEDYIQSVTEFAHNFTLQADLTDEYFKKTFSDYSHDPLFDSVISESQKQTINLFTGEPVQAQFIEPVRQILKSSVTSGSRMQDAIKTISSFIEGDEKLGALARYTKQVAYDSFAVFDRDYTNVISQALEVEWYRYTGGLIRDSREFCKQRHDHYYHRKEIEQWASRDWQGKRDGTNSSTIFVYLGGYQCKHSLIPVSESNVPKSDIDRAKQEGYIK